MKLLNEEFMATGNISFLTTQGRRLRLLAAALGLFVLGVAFCPAQKAKKTKATKKQAAPAPESVEPFGADRPVMTLDGLHCQVHQAGVVRQNIVAQTGRFDETARVMDMDNLQVKFLDEKTTVVGQVKCGYGRIWLTTIGENSPHDMLLEKEVRLRTGTNMQISTPQMHYTAKDSTIKSDKGFVQQYPAGPSYMIGRGVKFTIQLQSENNTFNYMKEEGDPKGAPWEMRKSDKPVLEP